MTVWKHWCKVCGVRIGEYDGGICAKASCKLEYRTRMGLTKDSQDYQNELEAATDVFREATRLSDSRRAAAAKAVLEGESFSLKTFCDIFGIPVKDIAGVGPMPMTPNALYGKMVGPVGKAKPFLDAMREAARSDAEEGVEYDDEGRRLFFVDPVRGDDRNPGTRHKPHKTWAEMMKRCANRTDIVPTILKDGASMNGKSWTERAKHGPRAIDYRSVYPAGLAGGPAPSEEIEYDEEGGRLYFIDAESGMDTNAGSRSWPLKTVAEALKRSGFSPNEVVEAFAKEWQPLTHEAVQKLSNAGFRQYDPVEKKAIYYSISAEKTAARALQKLEGAYKPLFGVGDWFVRRDANGHVVRYDIEDIYKPDSRSRSRYVCSCEYGKAYFHCKAIDSELGAGDLVDYAKKEGEFEPKLKVGDRVRLMNKNLPDILIGQYARIVENHHGLYRVKYERPGLEKEENRYWNKHYFEKAPELGFEENLKVGDRVRIRPTKGIPIAISGQLATIRAVHSEGDMREFFVTFEDQQYASSENILFRAADLMGENESAFKVGDRVRVKENVPGRILTGTFCVPESVAGQYACIRASAGRSHRLGEEGFFLTFEDKALDFSDRYFWDSTLEKAPETAEKLKTGDRVRVRDDSGFELSDKIVGQYATIKGRYKGRDLMLTFEDRELQGWENLLFRPEMLEAAPPVTSAAAERGFFTTTFASAKTKPDIFEATYEPVDG